MSRKLTRDEFDHLQASIQSRADRFLDEGSITDPSSAYDNAWEWMEHDLRTGTDLRRWAKDNDLPLSMLDAGATELRHAMGFESGAYERYAATMCSPSLKNRLMR